MSKRDNIDFVGKIKIALFTSISIIVLGIIFIAFQGGLNYNIEFNGGYLMHAGFYEKVDIADIRNTFSSTDLKGIEIQEFSDSNAGTEKFGTEVILKVETMDQDIKVIENKITDILNNKFGADAYEVRQSSSIGPKVGNELKTSTLEAIIWSLFFVLIYITIKFQFRYGVAAIMALLHDVLFTVGILSVLGYLFDYEISLSVIAAILTIVGYSLNDTIVVFDRIRENVKKLEGMDFDKMINISINETLTRTILTSLTTLFVVTILILFGGEVIRSLAVTLFVGIAVGTYSSIFIASPLLIIWDKSIHKKRNLRRA